MLHDVFISCQISLSLPVFPPSFPTPSLCNSWSFLFVFSFYFPAASSCAFSYTVLSSPSLCSYVFISQYLFLSSMCACKTAFPPTLAKVLGPKGLPLSTSSVIIWLRSSTSSFEKITSHRLNYLRQCAFEREFSLSTEFWRLMQIRINVTHKPS